MSTPARSEQTTAPRDVWRIVAGREIATRIRDKAFLGSTIFTLVLVGAVFVLSAVISGGAEEHDVAVVDDRSAVLAAAEQALGTPEEPATVRPVEVFDTAAAEEAVRAGDADAALLPADDGVELVVDGGVSSSLEAALRSAVASTTVAENAETQGVDVAALTDGSVVVLRDLDPQADEAGARSGVAFGFAIVFLFTALSFGMAISQSVVREKESRVVEILAAAVPIRALLWGKIAGNTVLALGQVLLLVAASVLGLAFTQPDLLGGLTGAVAWYVVLFLLGFVTLAALWSVAGSLASKQEDLQSTTLPGQLLIFAPYFISVLAGEEVRTVFSMLPIVSTMVMPGRLAEGTVPLWQVGVAIGATLVAAVVFVRIGERLFERTVLRTGGKMSYRQALFLPE